MTDCPNGAVRDALPDYLNDRLDPALRPEVESHLAGCATCREELSLLRALRATVHRAPAVDVETIAAGIPPYRAPVRRQWATNARIAAAIVALAVGGTSVALLRARSSAAPLEVTPPVAVAPVPSPDSTPLVPAPTSATAAGERLAPAGSAADGSGARELAIAGGSIADLSDRELSTLVDGIESMDGVPSAEVEAPEPVSIPAREGI